MYRNETEAAHLRVTQLEDRVEELSAYHDGRVHDGGPRTSRRKRPSTLGSLALPLVLAAAGSVGIAALSLYWLGAPKAQTVMRTNAGPSVSVLFRTNVSDVQIHSEDGREQFTPLSVGFSNIKTSTLLGGSADERPSNAVTPSRVTSVLLPPSQVNQSGLTKLRVQYRAFGFKRETTIVFDGAAEDSRFARNVLESMPTSWVAFSKPSAKSVIYFSTMLSYKYAIREIRYGFDDDPLDQRVHFEESNVANITLKDEIYKDAPENAKQVRVQIVFKDNTETPVRTILRSDATLP